MNGTDGYCLVLSGGGAKGVYHVGAWRALSELGIRVDAFIGNSIGAIISGFLAQGLFAELERLATDMGIGDVLRLPGDLVRDGDLRLDLESLPQLGELAADFVSSRGLDTSPMRSLLRSYIDEDKIRASGVDLGVVTVNVSDLAPREVFLDAMEPGSLVDYLMASAAFPGFANPVIKGKKYIDGGLYDNLPYAAARRRGYRRIIVIDISGPGFNRRPEIAGSQTVYIKNSIEMGGVLDFDREFLDRFTRLGYLDTMRVFGRCAGYSFFVETDAETDAAAERRLRDILRTIAGETPKRPEAAPGTDDGSTGSPPGTGGEENRETRDGCDSVGEPDARARIAPAAVPATTASAAMNGPSTGVPAAAPVTSPTGAPAAAGKAQTAGILLAPSSPIFPYRMRHDRRTLLKLLECAGSILDLERVAGRSLDAFADAVEERRRIEDSHADAIIGEPEPGGKGRRRHSPVRRLSNLVMSAIREASLDRCPYFYMRLARAPVLKITGAPLVRALEAFCPELEPGMAWFDLSLGRRLAGLVDLEERIPEILLDMRYATERNHFGRSFYASSGAWLLEGAASRLAAASAIAARRGRRLVVLDAYRPLSVQKSMWEFMPDEDFVAPPARGSAHNRGAAVDLTLADGEGRQLPMPSSFDEFSERASHSWNSGDPAALANRDELRSILEQAGFRAYGKEWWHYTDPDLRNAPLLDR